MKDKILTMFFDINRWTKAIEKGVLKEERTYQTDRRTNQNSYGRSYVEW
jgi:hypothetical protein